MTGSTSFVVTSSRNRLSSMPVLSNGGDDSGQQRHKLDVWRHLDEGRTRLRLKSREAVMSHAPLQWQPMLLDVAEIIFRHFDIFFIAIRRQFGPEYSSDPAESPSTVMTKANVVRFVATVCFLIAIVVFVYAFLLKTVFQLLLPFYAAYKAALWFFSWRRLNNSKNPTDEISVSFVVKLLYYCSLLDTACVIAAHLAFDASSNAQITILQLLPLISFAIFRYSNVYFDVPSEEQSRENELWSTNTSFTFALIFSLRLFACKGFVLLPLLARPYFSYIAIYLALKSGTNISTRKHASNNIAMAAPSANNGGKAVYLCAHCTGNLVSGTSTVQPPTLTAVNCGKMFKLNSADMVDSTTMNYQQQRRGSAGRTSRRVSLPAGSLVPIKPQTNLSEARGLIGELLSQKDLHANTVTGLRALLTLLNPNNVAPTMYDLLSGLPTIVDTPFIGEQFSLNADSLSSRRCSPVTWSTVTSATGLPTLEPEPNRPRSSSYWKQKQSEEIAAVTVDKQQLCQKVSLESTDFLIQTLDGTLFDVDELEHDQHLSNLCKWSLLIFDLHAASPSTLLSRVAFSAFRQSRLFNVFKIPRQKFFNFFHALEKGYWDIPYHNAIHASDVLHGTFYFTKVPNAAVNGNEDGLASILSSLELLALYTAAAMHDYDHPGRTNAFLVATGDPKAILYNDRSVLENHHAAAAWKLLSQQHNNFVEILDAAEYKRFRYIVMEAILATDLKRHFEILMEFNEKVSRGLDWENEADKLLVSQICVKMADINSPTKPFQLHTQWTNRILEEFYAQGDDEREKGLPVSAYMDRAEPQVAKLQDSFIAHLVKPLVHAMHTAGLLPNDDEEGNEPEMVKNIEENHKHWRQELGEVDPPPTEHHTSNSQFENDTEEMSSGEMETIAEDEDENTSA